MVDEAGIQADLWLSDDGLADRKAARSIAATVGKVIGAKPFPKTAQRLAELTRDRAPRMDEVVRVLEIDPGLSSKLLRLVNSAGYALQIRCTSVRHASMLVGADQLHQIATTAAVMDLFDAKSDVSRRILEHTTVVGAFSRYLGAHLGLPAEDLFTCGFLHDIGKLMLLETEGKPYLELLEQNLPHEQLHLAERERFGFDHAVLGGYVLRAWEIPDPVPKVVAAHHHVGRIYGKDDHLAVLVHTVRLADTIAHVMESPDHRDRIGEVASSSAAVDLEISENQLDAIWAELHHLYLHATDQVSGDGSIVIDMASCKPSIVASNPRGLRDAGDHTAERHEQHDSDLTPSEAPRQFPCVVCDAPSFGNICPSCRGHVCPDHITDRDQWCLDCLHAWGQWQRDRRFPAPLFFGASAFLTALLLSTLLGAVLGAPPSATRALGGLSSVLLVASLMGWIVRQSLLKRAFLHYRPNRYRGAETSPASTASLYPMPDQGSLAPRRDEARKPHPGEREEMPQRARHAVPAYAQGLHPSKPSLPLPRLPDVPDSDPPPALLGRSMASGRSIPVERPVLGEEPGSVGRALLSHWEISPEQAAAAPGQVSSLMAAMAREEGRESSPEARNPAPAVAEPVSERETRLGLGEIAAAAQPPSDDLGLPAQVPAATSADYAARGTEEDVLPHRYPAWNESSLGASISTAPRGHGDFELTDSTWNTSSRRSADWAEPVIVGPGEESPPSGLVDEETTNPEVPLARSPQRGEGPKPEHELQGEMSTGPGEEPEEENEEPTRPEVPRMRLSGAPPPVPPVVGSPIAALLPGRAPSAAPAPVVPRTLPFTALLTSPPPAMSSLVEDRAQVPPRQGSPSSAELPSEADSTGSAGESPEPFVPPPASARSAPRGEPPMAAGQTPRVGEEHGRAAATDAASAVPPAASSAQLMELAAAVAERVASAVAASVAEKMAERMAEQLAIAVGKQLAALTSLVPVAPDPSRRGAKPSAPPPPTAVAPRRSHDGSEVPRKSRPRSSKQVEPAVRPSTPPPRPPRARRRLKRTAEDPSGESDAAPPKRN